MSITDGSLTRNDELRAELREECLRECAGAVVSIRQAMQAIAKNPTDVARLQELHSQIRSLAGNASVTRLLTIARVVGTFDALLKQLVDKPDSVTQSVRRTMAQSIDLLGALFEGDGQEVDLAMARTLAVDDQQIALRSVMNALEKANLKPQALSDPSAGFSVAEEWQFDLIVLDHSMPRMTGVELCAKLRALPNYKKIPILFVTSASAFENRAEICRSGGTDVIAKPFLATELGLKALTLIIKSKIF
ncbi:MAG TPA: response regulator [Verrucomicrobiae bacterium]|nr:response regulator [Verrucomicrobiae bacterium]